MNKAAKCINRDLITLLILTISLLTLSVRISVAQSSNKAFRYFTPQEGFPSFAYRLEQGEKGRIWITGPSGLVSFDGYEAKVHTPDPSDSTSISDEIIAEVLNDNNGHLWLRGLNGVSIYDFGTESFRKVPIPDSLPPYRFGSGILQTSDSLVWVGVGDGVYSFSIPTAKQPQPNVSYFEIKEIKGNSERMADLIEGPDGKIWASSTEGLYFLDPEKGTYTVGGPFNQLPDSAGFYYNSYMVKDHEGTVWISIEGGLLKFTDGLEEPEFLSTLGEENFSLEGLVVYSMTLARDGSIWIGTESQGALQYHPTTDKLRQYTSNTNDRESISEITVNDILEDMDGNIWFSHLGNGMSMMYDKAWNYTFKKITETDDIDSNQIYYLEADKDDNIWAATRNGLAFIPIDGGSNQVFTPTSDAYIAPDQRWFSTVLPSGKDDLFLFETTNKEGNRLHRFDKKEFRFIDVLAIDSLVYTNSFISDGVRLYWTRRGDSKLVMLDPADMRLTSLDLPVVFPEFDGDADTLLYVNPYVSKSGDLYLQYNYEFEKERTISKRIYFKFDSQLQFFSEVPLRLPDSKRSVKMDRKSIVSQKEDGVFYTRTNVGLLKEDVISGQSSLIISESAAENYSFGSLLEDMQGNLWYSDMGSTLSKLDILTLREQSFTMDMNRNPKWSSETAELSNGDIILGGRGGYIQFNPAEIREESNIKKLFIDEFRTGATYYTNLKPEEEYEVEYEDNNLSFRFVGINFRTGDTKYRYRLPGYEDEWVELGNQRHIFFAGLPFGNYRFQVQATKGGSSFTDNSVMAELQFKILPPWWRTTVAYIIYLILFVGFIYGLDRFQRRRLISREREKSRERELEQAREIEKAYENLKAAKDQLIQQEKLASLGQLTAGIAHEIKNPLNFVNNFSEVSVELIDEALEEIEKLDDSEIKEEIVEILNDVKGNLTKVHSHGTRADSIVKSMLQHSRGGSGKMEPTDLNALIKEYVNLSFHGMRAGKDPINVDIQFDLDEKIGKVDLIGEDFSRVVLNLANNAFDAMREKAKTAKDYLPKFSVKTELTANGQQLIAISDNGPGIPEELKDKILQPFFTTKKGTEGTGLGLSITNDIVKAHGGELQVQSELGKGTTFSIQLKDQNL